VQRGAVGEGNAQSERGRWSRERHLRDLESRLSYFAAKFDGDTVGTITRREIDDFLRELPVGPMTRNHYRSVVVQMFNFAKKNGYAAKNPAADAAKAKVIGETPGILTIEQASALLSNA